MILRFSPAATEPARRAVLDALDDLEIEFQDYGEFLVLGGEVRGDGAVRLGSMEGVESISPADRSVHTVRETFLRWTAANCLVLGILVLLAANVPAGMGPPADPLRTPPGLRPSWPMLPWQTLEDRAPPWLPVPFLVLVGSLLLLGWPFLARRLAERRPALHAAAGAIVLLAGIGLALLGWLR